MKNSDNCKKYYGSLKVSVAIKTKLEKEKFLSMFQELKANLKLKTVDGGEHDTDVLDVQAEWVDWNNL